MGRPTKKSHAPQPEIVFGQILREIREIRGMSQEALGHESGYHRTYIGLLERGEYRPSLETLFLLGRALDIRPSQLLERVEARIGSAPVSRRRGRLR